MKKLYSKNIKVKKKIKKDEKYNMKGDKKIEIITMKLEELEREAELLEIVNKNYLKYYN